jgi:hypothetical protein
LNLLTPTIPISPRLRRSMVEGSGILILHFSGSHIDCHQPALAYQDV